MTTTKNRRIVDLMYEYYDLRDRIDTLTDQSLAIKQRILALANPGKYGKFSILECKEVEINVRAYVRRGYKSIRRSL